VQTGGLTGESSPGHHLGRDDAAFVLFGVMMAQSGAKKETGPFVSLALHLGPISKEKFTFPGRCLVMALSGHFSQFPHAFIWDETVRTFTFRVKCTLQVTLPAVCTPRVTLTAPARHPVARSAFGRSRRLAGRFQEPLPHRLK